MYGSPDQMTATEVIRGKTEQRIVAVIAALRSEPKRFFTYEELSLLTGAHYDACLYILATLCEVGVASRSLEQTPGPGRSKVQFQWNTHGARGLGPRKRQTVSLKVT